MSGKDKWVRRFSVDETARHKNGFTIYKITSVLFPIESPEAVTVVSVWKRFSEVRRLHKNMMALHAGLHLKGSCPLPKFSYFRRFQREVIEERARAIKRVLEFIAEHRLLFTSSEFVTFLQSGYEAPREPAAGEGGAPRPGGRHDPAPRGESPSVARDETDLSDIPQIPIYEAALVERRADSLASLASLDSLDDALCDQLDRFTLPKKSVKNKSMLPDLIDFEAPSGSQSGRSPSSLSLSSKTSVPSLSVTESRTRTEDSYVFEAGYMLNLAARCEDMGNYQRAFECYKSGIEKLLVGVQTDSDPQRRALVKEKTNKYLSYAEDIYKNHLCNADDSPPAERPLTEHPAPAPAERPVPAGTLRRAPAELAHYRVLAALPAGLMLVLHHSQACYAMKVIQKIPNNLTEFDEYFQRADDTRPVVLPTGIPYMVPLHAYVETPDLLFLVLEYAPGERLLDYVAKYAASPARELDLRNVFSEPGKRDNIASDASGVVSDGKTGDEVQELVKNSQRLLRDVDRVLRERRDSCERDERDERGEIGESEREVTPDCDRVTRDADSGEDSTVNFRRRGVPGVPGGARRRWAAQLLAALAALHRAGVVCWELRAAHVLLGARGQALLTYRVGRARDVAGARAGARRRRAEPAPHVAPELRHPHALPPAPAAAADYWGYGAFLYHLLAGVPLSHHHGEFTSHTQLVLPAHLSVEEKSLLTQLLTYDPAARLGSGGAEEVKRHPYFRHVDWDRVHREAPV